MTNTADGTSWTITEPGDTDPRNEGATEIRGLRAGVGIRIDKEHVTLSGSASPADGGEHKAGSAVAYRANATEPTKRPDGATDLTTADTGRLYIDSADEKMYSYVFGTGWVAVAPSVLGTNIMAVDASIATAMKTSAGWLNNTGNVVFLNVFGDRSTPSSSGITLEVENTNNDFVTVATGIRDSTGDIHIQASVLVPDANHARIRVAGQSVGGGWAITAHRTQITLT